MKRACGASAILAGVLAALVLPAGAFAAAARAAAAPGSSPPPAPATAIVWVAPGGVGGAGGTGSGGSSALSAAQAQQLLRIRQAARSWQAALAAPAAAAQRQGDATLAADLGKLETLLQQLANQEQLTFAAYVAALNASRQALSQWAAAGAYVEPAEQTAWQEADAGATALTTAAETGFVFGADLDSGTAWTYGEGAGSGAGEPSGAASTGADASAASTASTASTADVADESPADEADEGEMSAAPEALAADAAGSSGTGGGAVPAPDPGWVVIHGGADASWQSEAAPAVAGAPVFALQLGDLPGDAALAADAPVGEGDDEVAASAVSPIAWEEICRPWQPGADRDVCSVTAPAAVGL
jgi:hypothetical protein